MKSWHFIPSHKPEYFEKLDMLDAAAIIFDLEDGVPENLKEYSYQQLELNRELIKKQNAFLRLNKIEDGYVQKEIALFSKIEFKGVVLPKVCHYSDISNFKSKFEKLNNSSNDISIVALIESMIGLNNLNKIIEAKEIGLKALGLGLEDLLSDFTQISPSEAILDYLKSKMVMCCKANDLLAIDTVSLNINEPKKFMKECISSNRLLFDGKFSIHPSQVSIINEYFSPTDDDIAWAKNIVSRSDNNINLGYQKNLDQIISPPKLKKANLILKKACIDD